MAMTDKVKDELSRFEVTRTCCRKAEVASLLRFAGGLHKVGRAIVVEAELDTASAARRLRKDIIELYGYETEIMQLAAGGLRRLRRRTPDREPQTAAGRLQVWRQPLLWVLLAFDTVYLVLASFRPL